jgi:alkyl hydroperoxide reductase subunit AhpC
LKEIEEGYGEAEKRGIDVIAVSMDTMKLALTAKQSVAAALG